MSRERPGRNFTYTSNWPPDELLGNTPPGHLIVVSVLSFVLSSWGGVGALAWFYAATRESWASTRAAEPRDPLITGRATPSMYATVKYFWIVGLLLVPADDRRDGDRPLRCGRNRAVRCAACPVAPLLPHPDMARAAGHVLDRHGVAGHGSLPGSHVDRPRAAVSTTGRERPVWSPAPGGGRLLDGTGVGNPPPAQSRCQFLGRTSGIRIPGPGPAVATAAVWRPALLDGVDAALPRAGNPAASIDRYWSSSVSPWRPLPCSTAPA